ncbi:MAG: hypothetical protein WC364_14580 [Eubacteriales bacterium]
MKKSGVIEVLQKNTDPHNVVCVNRNEIDSDLLFCIPLIIEQNFLLAHYLYDFNLDGYIIVRIKDITSVKSDEKESYIMSILKNESIYYTKEPPIIRLNNMKIIFTDLKNLNKIVIIESESIQNGDFYIGKIMEIKRSSLVFLSFNELGEWDEETKEIMYKDITMIKFDDNYSTIFSKYVKLIK